MANVTIKAEAVVDAAELSLQRAIVLPSRMWSDLTRDDFVGAKNDTVTLRLPAVVEATIRDLRSTADVVFGEITETSVPVTLSKQVIVPIRASLVEQELDLVPFAQRFVKPAIQGLARGVENVVAGVLDAAIPLTTVAWNGTAGGVKAAMIAAGTAFNAANVPSERRTFVVGVNSYGDFVDYASTIPAPAGIAPGAYLDAFINRLFGFDIIWSNAIDPDAVFAMSPYAVAYTAFGPKIPAGAVDGATGSQDGIGFSVIQDYDPVKQSDRLAVTSFVGATSVEIAGKNPFLIRVGDFS